MSVKPWTLTAAFATRGPVGAAVPFSPERTRSLTQQPSENSTHRPGAQRDMRPLILAVLALVGLLIVVALQLKKTGGRSAGPALPSVGRPAPDFAFADLNGRTVWLSAQRGKIVLVNIWATWCPPCVEEMPSMQKLYRSFERSDLEILAVSVDALGAEAVAPFMRQNKLSFPALIDAKGTMKTLYGTTGIPESFILDRQGRVVKKIIGPVDWAGPEALAFFRDLIAGKTTPP